MFRPASGTRKCAAIGRDWSAPKLIDAAISAIREQGYAATSVDGLCGMAGVTKGAFFHHFKSKDALAIAATHWLDRAVQCLVRGGALSRLQRPTGPSSELPRFPQGVAGRDTHRAELPRRHDGAGGIRIASRHRQSVRGVHLRTCGYARSRHRSGDERYRVRGRWTAASLALDTQAVLQGAFILAQAKGGADVAIASVEHLRRYIELLFKKERRTRGKEKGT